MKNLRRWWRGAVMAAALGNFGAMASGLEVAGTLYVDLDANDLTAGSVSWANSGTLGNFVEVGDPRFVTVAGGVNAVVFDGVDDAYQSPVAAPDGLVGLDPTRTIEAWVLNPNIASEETIVSWGHRGGPDGSNMSFNYGSHGSFGAVGHWGGADIGWVDASTDGAPAAMQWHHLVYTYDGTTTRVYSDGVLRNSEVLGSGAINTNAGTKITVASQLENAAGDLTGGLKGSLAISRLRVHDGVLDDAQVLANYNALAGSYVNPPAPEAPVAKPLSSGPIHRYSFNNTAAADAAGGVLEDSIGGAHGVVLGAGSSFTGSRLKLPGGSSETQAYGDLPNGLVSSHQEVTIEGWVSLDGAQNWGRIFDFGSNEPGGVDGEITGPGDTNAAGGAGLDYLMLSGGVGTDYNVQRVELRNEDPAGGGVMTFDSATPSRLPQDIHFAVVFDEEAGLFGETIVSYYRDGVLKGQGTTNAKLADINDVNNWLGRSNWTGDSNLEGSFDEFRIYDRALTGDEVLGNYQAGPDRVNVVPEPATLAPLAALALGIFGRRRRK